ncbi:hypothetical protein TRFO_21582 [Tritrichomonas foetus]|uniref:Uncharacterized protein n=1 Tax=Tritrichomonas foetus TaxID=1144522 RepID=A0A1J4KI90_9EUKA|nr:hypothetical protein TRFO_21582 [Tritrichomonas foetus]|eukprot:OHT09532.1 hypothetical protein TRFO_21582 [Tritrichomonas foetus]
MNYKILENPKDQLQKMWWSGGEADSIIEDGGPKDIEREKSRFYRRMLLNLENPLDEILKVYGNNTPNFDRKFLKNAEHFLSLINDDSFVEPGIQLFEYIIFGNPRNILSLKFNHLIPFLVSNLPRSFELFSFLLYHSNPQIQHILNEFEWENSVFSFIYDQNYHLYISIILKYAEIKENTFKSFFQCCSKLLYENETVTDKRIILNVMHCLANKLFEYDQMEVIKMLKIRFFQYPNNFLNDSEICQKLFEILSNMTNDDTIISIIDFIPSFCQALHSNNEDFIKSASEFAVSIVAFEQGFEILTSPQNLIQILDLAENSLFSIKSNMITLICEIIMQAHTQLIEFILSKNVLEIFFTFLEVEERENTIEILQSIEYMINYIEETDQIDYVVDKIIEYDDVLQKLALSEISSISRLVEIIQNQLRPFKML